MGAHPQEENMCTAKDDLEALEKAGFTQTFISGRTKISQPTLSRILSGNHKDPKSSTTAAIRKLAEKCLANKAKA